MSGMFLSNIILFYDNSDILFKNKPTIVREPIKNLFFPNKTFKNFTNLMNPALFKSSCYWKRENMGVSQQVAHSPKIRTC